MLRKSVNLFIFLGIIAILFASPLASTNAFADNKDRDKNQKLTNCFSLANFDDVLKCLKDASNQALSAGSLDDVKSTLLAVIKLIIGESDARKLADTNLQNQITNIQLTPGPQGPPGPPGTINAQTCPSGDYVSGISQGGALICTQLPSGSTAAVCGNGVVESGEQCDTSKIDTVSCNGLTCTTSTCGDGYVNKAAGEQCDDGGKTDTTTCLQSPAAGSLDCKISVCGDGYVNLAAGEQCDSSGTDTTSCNGLTCKVSACGDGYVNRAAGEQCDLGQLNSNNPGSTCTTSCKLP